MLVPLYLLGPFPLMPGLPLSESTLELVDAPGALKEVIYFRDRVPVVSVSDVATGYYYI